LATRSINTACVRASRMASWRLIGYTG
jgi:hypothetical protein